MRLSLCSRWWQWRGPTCILVVALHVLTASANTEIVNILAEYAADEAVPDALGWPVLSSATQEIAWEGLPAPLHTKCEGSCMIWDADSSEHEKWAVLDLDSTGWASFSKFTLRISWPAFYPTDFYIHTFSPDAARTLLVNGTARRDITPSQAPSQTRRQYVRIRMVDTGVRDPSMKSETHLTSFMIILEPLYFGVLPASVIPVLLFLIPVILSSVLFVAPRVHTYLHKVAGEVSADPRGFSARKEE